MVRPGRRYNSYKGRRSKGKTALAVLLVLVILVAVVVILMQRNIIYDETGSPRMEVPWKEDTAEEAVDEPELDLVIQVPEKTAPEIQGFRIPAGLLNQEGYDSAMAKAGPGYTAVAVVLKDESGAVYFDAKTAAVDEKDIAADTAAVLSALTGTSFHTVAEINCFHDPKAASANVEEMGLKDTEGHIFYDGENHQWLDPAKPQVRQYVCELAEEAAQMGFDEILLTDLSYPTHGKLEQIAYGETEKSENLKLFLEELQTVLEPYGILISVEVSANVVTAEQDDLSGQKLEEIAGVADRIYVKTTAEEIAGLAKTLKAAGEISFVPMVADYHPTLSGSYLVIG